MKYPLPTGEPRPGGVVLLSEANPMTDQTNHNHSDERENEAKSGLRATDVLAVLSVASFLAAIGLVTFFVTSSLAG